MPVTRIRVEVQGHTVVDAARVLDSAVGAIQSVLPYALGDHAVGDRVFTENENEPGDASTRWDARAVIRPDVSSILQPDGGWSAQPGMPAAEQFSVAEYAWEGTGTPEAHATWGVYDRSLQGRTGHLVCGGLSNAQARRIAYAMNMPVGRLRQLAYDVAQGHPDLIFNDEGEPDPADPPDPSDSAGHPNVVVRWGSE